MISIIILNWNRLSDTIECLKSVSKIDYPDYEIIVVDNGSTDGSPEAIARLFPKITLIGNKENLGFAEGNNIGIRRALKNSSEFILLLNNDTVVDTQILKSFIEAACLYPDAGILGAKIYYYSEPNRIWYTRTKWDNSKADFVSLDENLIDDNSTVNDIVQTDYVCGCALFMRTSIIKEVGLLNEKFFLCWEEIDFCSRARNKGFKCLVVPKSKVWHKVSTSFNGDNTPLKEYFNTRNVLLWAKMNLPFFKKWHVYKVTTANIFKLFFPGIYETEKYPLIKRLYWDLLEIKQNYRRPNYKAKVLGLRDFIFMRFGNCTYKF